MRAVDLPGLRRLAPILCAAKTPLLLMGPPGSGKTSFFRDFARGGFHSESAAHCAPEDIGGLPDLTGDRTRYRLPEWLPLVGDASPDNGILLFDDVADAPRAVQASLYEIVCSRTIRGKPLKPGWWIVSCCNRPEDLSAADPVSFAFANRGAVATYAPTAADTATLAFELSWAKPLPEYYAWVIAAKQEVCPVNMEQVALGEYAQPTNRSRSLLSDAIRAGATSADYALFVGMAEATKLTQYESLLAGLPLPAQIAAQPSVAAVPDQMGAQYAVVLGLVSYVSEDLARCSTLESYVGRLGKPLQSYYRAAVRDRTPEILANPAWAAWAKKVDIAKATT